MATEAAELNDTYGHEVGDTAVVATAKAVLEATERCDVVAAWGATSSSSFSVTTTVATATPSRRE